MRNLVLVGNSHAGRECYHIFKDMLEHDCALRGTIRFKGFLSHNGYRGNLGKLAEFLLGSDNEYAMESNDYFSICIGDNRIRREIYENLNARGAKFFTLLSPFARVSRDIVLGNANIVGYGCAFSCDIRVGNANYFNSQVTLGHDVLIGDYNFLAYQATLLGGTRIGSGNHFGPRSLLLDRGRVGDNNRIAPGAFLYKGCGNERFMAGNPALPVT
ncbi:MAG: transferase [Desulfovibrio sp.]|jgi:acetyltransferase-like isoleucine patch superfamily enzyme|nr:transferase [Desulfovibrio sp.]